MAVKQLMEQVPDMDGLFCGNDQMAIGVMKYLNEHEKRIPEDIDYEDVGSLRIEAKQKLSKIRPSSIGQASRISGVSPADISVLLIYLEQMHHRR